MASPDPFDLAAFGEFFERVGTRRLDQPKPRNGTADIRRNELKRLRRLPLRRSAEDPKNDREDVSNCT
jgi:hypothetical protein